MANYYLKCVDDLAWPPVTVTNFINLALIGDNTSWRETVQGSMDEILGEKETIKYQHVFDYLDQFSFILFEGRPGSGKTTLMSKISQDWANGLFLESKLILLIPLRQLNTFHERTLATLIKVACPPFKEDEIKSLELHLETMNGRNVIFIFDGFDEYSPINCDIVLYLMNKYRSFLRDAVVVVSSRPAACHKYRIHADKCIEVIGFLKDQVVQYIHHYYNNNVEKAEQLLGHLKQHSNLMNMCYLPLHCAMLVFFYDGSAFLPETETEFYKHFTISTLLRSFYKISGNVTCLTSFDQIPSKDKVLFDKVCKLAFEATIGKKQVFKLSDLQEIFIESGSTGSDESCLGLVVVDRCFLRFGLDETYTFLHLTFQEFLAAVYMAGLSYSEQVCIIEQRYESGKEDMRVVYRFLCGMLDFELPGAMEVFKAMQLGSKPNDYVSKLMLVQWAYESQSEQPYNYILCDMWNGCFHLDLYMWAISHVEGPAIASLLNNKNAYTMVVNLNDEKIHQYQLSKDELNHAIFNLVDNKALQITINIDM